METTTTKIYTLSLHDALPIYELQESIAAANDARMALLGAMGVRPTTPLRVAALGERTLRSEEHTSELQSLRHLVCRLLLEKKKHTIAAHAEHLSEKLLRQRDR